MEDEKNKWGLNSETLNQSKSRKAKLVKKKGNIQPIIIQFICCQL